MRQGYRSKETCVFLVNYHLIWCPKLRRKVLVDRVRARFDELIRETAPDLECEILALEILPDHLHIVVEKLNITGMVRNQALAKSISDAGWALFVNVLRAKAVSGGRVALEVNPAGTSQWCAACGEHVPKRLAVR